MLISCRYYLILVWSIVPISKALGTTLPLYSNFTLHLRPLTHTHMFQWVCNCLYMWIIASERAKRQRETSIKNINRAQLEIRVGAKFPRHNQPERERESESQLWRQELQQLRREHCAWAEPEVARTTLAMFWEREQLREHSCDTMRERANQNQNENENKSRWRCWGCHGSRVDLPAECVFDSCWRRLFPSRSQSLSRQSTFFPVYFVPCVIRNPRKNPLPHQKREIFVQCFHNYLSWCEASRKMHTKSLLPFLCMQWTRKWIDK